MQEHIEHQNKVVNILISAEYGDGAKELDPDKVYFRRSSVTDHIEFFELPEDFLEDYQKFDITRNMYLSRVWHESFASVPLGNTPPEYIYTHLTREQAEKEL